MHSRAGDETALFEPRHSFRFEAVTTCPVWDHWALHIPHAVYKDAEDGTAPLLMFLAGTFKYWVLCMKEAGLIYLYFPPILSVLLFKHFSTLSQYSTIKLLTKIREKDVPVGAVLHVTLLVSEWWTGETCTLYSVSNCSVRMLIFWRQFRYCAVYSTVKYC